MESTEEQIFAKLQDLATRVAALETTVSGFKPEPKGISFEHLGGKKIHYIVSVRRTEPISFEHLGGRKVGQHNSTRREVNDDNSTE